MLISSYIIVFLDSSKVALHYTQFKTNLMYLLLGWGVGLYIYIYI